MTASEGKAEITTSDPRALEREVELRRAQLAGTIDELSGRLQPAAIRKRALTSARERATAFATHPDGTPRTGRLAAAGAAVLGVTALLVVRAVRKRR
ncbi:DUF3618 domain-containing protein [Kineococcus sp. SYSU DK005]|uniref:DUF3618 domain-containing protein n=1 Tax=Kineococcus sp. SYSU DK005 TaxID=3383126 RepID=UPI003D7D4F17